MDGKKLEYKGEEALKEIERLTMKASEVQENLLKQILTHNRETEYLNKFMRGEKNITEFKSFVPVTTYERIFPYIQRIANGEDSSLITGHQITEMLCSSGTSGGEPKIMPSIAEDLERRTFVYNLIMPIMNQYVPDLDEGKAMYLFFVKAEMSTPCGLPARTVLTSYYKSKHFKCRTHDPWNDYTSPDQTILCNDSNQSMHCQLLAGLVHRRQVLRLGAVFASAFLRAISFLERNWRQLCEDIRSGKLSSFITDPSCRSCMSTVLSTPDPRLADEITRICSQNSWKGILCELWPKAKYIEAVVTGSMAQYVPALKHYSDGKLPLVCTMYASSECYFGVNLKPLCDPGDVAFTLLPNMGYFEFLPLGHNGKLLMDFDEGDVPNDKLVDLVHVKLGCFYEPVVTTFAAIGRHLKLFIVVEVIGCGRLNPCGGVPSASDLSWKMSSDASSGDLPPSQGVDDIHTPTRKRGRSGTRLRELTTTRNADHRLPIRFDMQTCKSLGENSTKFISYVALLGRSKASILCDDWDHVPENVKNQIWQSILVTYDVPHTNLLRKKWISYAGERWKSFKTMLTSHYIYGSKTDKSPCEKYQFLDEETWQAFKLKRLDPSFQAKRRAAQETAKKNVHPHILSRGGYEKLEQKIMKEASASNPSGASDTSTITRPPRHVTWKRARQRLSGEYTSEETTSVARRIDELVEQSRQGTFTPEGREDILAVAIGRPEHPGRVRGVGKFIGIRQFFGPPKCHHSKAHVSEEVLKGIKEEIRQEMREEMREEMKKEYGDMQAQLKKEYSDMRAQFLADMRAELASPSSQPRNPPQSSHLCISTKESCDESPKNASPTIDADYELFSDDALQCLVALGKMYTLGSTIHHEIITVDMMRVVVVDVRDATARVPVPTQEVQTVGQAPGNFILWPVKLSRAIVKEVEAQGQEDIKESLQQPPQQTILEQLGVLAVKISLSPIKLQMPPEVTNRTSSLSFFIFQRDIFEILSGTDMLCISVLQLWLLYLHRLSIEKKNDHIYGFIDPVAIQRVGNKGEEVQKYLLEAFVNGKKQVYLAPYLQQGHWQLLLILPQEFLVVLLCSLHKKPRTLAIKSTLISVVEAYSRLQGTHIIPRKKLQFIAPTCSRQPGSFECGYYVMRHMQKIMSANIVDSWNLIFDDTSPMEQHIINDVREQWATFFLTICK